MDLLIHILFAVFLVLFYVRAKRGFLVNEKRRPIFIFDLILLLGATIYTAPIVYNSVMSHSSMGRISPINAMRVLLAIISIFIIIAGVKLLLKSKGE